MPDLTDDATRAAVERAVGSAHPEPLTSRSR